MNIVVVGLGYVGLPLSMLLSKKGYSVTGIDRDISKIKKLKSGVLPFARSEPGLKFLFQNEVNKKRLDYSSTFEKVKKAKYVIVAVNTPVQGKSPDYEPLKSALVSISKYLHKEVIIIIESTISPNSTLKVLVPLLEKESDMKFNQDFYVSVVPERIRPNYILKQLTSIPRVIGISNSKIKNGIKTLYTHITSGSINFTDITTAEVVKTVENSYRDVQIAFANEIAKAAEELGVNIWEIRELVNKSPFHNMHKPGAGVGGHCIPKDPVLFMSSLKHTKTPLLQSARNINSSMPNFILDHIIKSLKLRRKTIQSSKITILGYSYVENSEDSRNSPTISLIKLLKTKKIKYSIHDPYIKEYSKKKILSHLKGSDCLVLMVAHKQYNQINIGSISKVMRTKIIIDGRNLFDSEVAKENDILYIGVGNNPN